jgi:hypothetical protein
MRRTLRVLGATALTSCLLGLAPPKEPPLPELFPEPAQSPFHKITSKMTGVAVKLAKTETGEPTQTQEKAIVRDLDELIAALEKECAACRGGTKPNNPNRGMPDSFISRGTGGIGSLVNPAESQKDWAKLSERERDRILQSMSEGFPPEYRTVLERYYRRLAEEKGAAQPRTEPQPDQP